MDRTQRVEAEFKRRPDTPGLNYGEVSRATRSILLISQVEIDNILQKLFNLGLVSIEEVKKSRYRKEDSQEVSRTGDFVDERLIHLKEPKSFLEKARAASEELGQDEQWSRAMEMEFVDIFDFAASVGATPDAVYKKIGSEEIPPSLFFLHKSSAETWAQDMGSDFFSKAKRRQVSLHDLEGVGDIVFVDDETLRQVFTRLGFHKLSILFAASGGKAREKILSNVSQKIAGVIQDESSHIQLDEVRLAAVERELLDAIREIKGG